METSTRKRKRLEEEGPNEQIKPPEQEQEERTPALLLPLPWFLKHHEELKDFKLRDNRFFVNRDVWRWNKPDPWTLSMCYRTIWPETKPLAFESEIAIPERLQLVAPLCIAAFNERQARQLRSRFSDIDAANRQVREKLRSTGTQMDWDPYFQE